MRDVLRLRGHMRVRKCDAQGREYGCAEAHNLFLTSGVDELWRLALGQSASAFTAATALIGVGDSSAAADEQQMDLLGTATAYRPMSKGYPSAPAGGAVRFEAVFAADAANFSWDEFVVKNKTSGICLDRGVAPMGRKAPGTVWTATVTLSIA